MMELILERDGKKLFRKTIGDTPLTIGRAADNSVVLLDPEISRLHCLIEKKGESIEFKDLSKNGTLINGKLLREASLTFGDAISIGRWKLSIDGKSISSGEKTIASSPCATRVVSYDETEARLTTESVEFTVKTAGKPPVSKRIAIGEATIGTDPSCDIVVDDPYVSRRHCRVFCAGGSLALADLASTNGTFIGEGRVSRVSLGDSGSFLIGKTTVSHRTVRQVQRIVATKDRRFGCMTGSSRLIREAFALIDKVASSDATICITGESGTGKELVAKEIHQRSARRRNPMVAINCGALPSTIIESQLFGHERGAFTGATERSVGLIEQARGGTLFLDEIGEMPPEVQTRLLRVLENRSLRRIGGDSEISVDARFVVATNRDLKSMIREGKFREDLFFRIYVVPIFIPPLRERPEDIEVLASHFAKELSGGARSLTPAAMERLLAHTWPGNARELKNTIERTLILTQGNFIDSGDLRMESVSTRVGETADLRGKEKAIVAAALEECGGNLSRASRKLGIARTTLQKKIRRHAIPVFRPEAKADA